MVALSATSWQLPQRGSLLNVKAANLYVIASQLVGEAIQVLYYFLLDCFVALLLAMTTEWIAIALKNAAKPHNREPRPIEGEVSTQSTERGLEESKRKQLTFEA